MLYELSHAQQIVSAARCLCLHKPCESCTLIGSIKLYKPVEDPFVVQLLTEEDNQIKFGIFCGNCGLSWRARAIKPFSMLRKLQSSVALRRQGQSSSEKTVFVDDSTANLQTMTREIEQDHGQQAIL
ncbi:hypothetical protein GQ44DRAFT_698751 [Phaeosphaeriaceae sp. PMI808]|nr:hypothetical protein GQ44DRAFT_698751 [Phaeosphaeriaceae sp. PMI808]